MLSTRSSTREPQAEAAPGAREPILVVALQTGAAANGGIASLDQILRRLTRYRPVVLTNRESDMTGGWRAAGFEVHVVPERASRGWRRAPASALATYARYFTAVRRLLARTGARLIHANDPLAFQLSLPAARTRRGTAVVLNIRDTLAPERRPPRRKYAWLFRAADHTLFLSHDMAVRWAELTPAALVKSSATYSIVDFARFGQREPATRKPPVVLVSGIACEKKGQLAFLQAVAPEVTAAGIEIWFAGDFAPRANPYARACVEAAERFGDRVRFLGYRRDLPDLLAAASVVVVCSRHEGLMRTMIEAMATARPVVSTAVASAGEMLRQPGREAGVVVPHDRPQLMAEAIVRLCRAPEEARRMGENGAAIARELFGAERVVEAYEACYDSLLARA